MYTIYCIISLIDIPYKSTFAPNEGKSVKGQLSFGNVTRMSEHRHTADEHMYMCNFRSVLVSEFT